MKAVSLQIDDSKICKSWQDKRSQWKLMPIKVKKNWTTASDIFPHAALAVLNMYVDILNI